MRTVEDVLGLWVSGLLSSEAVVEWAGKELARLEEPPMELFSLASDGPEKCLKRSEAEFPYRPTEIGYAQQFAIRAISVDLASNESMRHLADWTAQNCIGEDPSEAFAKLGYRLDHYISDCQNTDGAIALLRAKLPSLLAHCQLLANAYAEADA
jgi:hypothetical protein